MRQLIRRTTLAAATSARLAAETAVICACTDEAGRKDLAEARYKAARRARWFQQVVHELTQLTGPGSRCMCCSGSESAQVEHYKGKADYPHKALEWEKFLWLCGICNLSKGVRFDESCPPVNPLEEDVWDFFFIDEYGNLCARWDAAINALNARAVETIVLYNLDRQALQETRLARLRELRSSLTDLIHLKDAGKVTAEELQARALILHDSPLQPDVADYYLYGPGATETPFSTYLAAADL